MINEIIELSAMICALGASYWFANRGEKTNVELLKQILEEHEEIKKLTDQVEKLTEISNIESDLLEIRTKQVYGLKEKVERRDKKIKQGAERFSKDQVKINCLEERLDLLSEEFEIITEINHARYGEISYLRKKIKTVRAKRLLKVVKAERLIKENPSEIGEGINKMFRDDMIGVNSYEFNK